jgi:primosomal protein N' (replication factor Y)
VCPSCSGALSGRGWGHERVARELERASIPAPVVRVVRGDEPGEHRPHPAVIVGTLAAANTTRNAGCVCVADLDQLLARPDFRASEYAFQVLHQLARSLAPSGRFLIQTREPEHHAVQGFVRNSYRYFYDRELPFREETRYPPFGTVVRVEIDPAALGDLRDAAEAAGGEVIGALPRGRKLNGLLRCRELDELLGPLRTFAGSHSGTKVDVDPVDVL